MSEDEKKRFIEIARERLKKGKGRASQLRPLQVIDKPVQQPSDYSPTKIVEPRFTRTLIRSVEEYELEVRP